MDEIKKDLINFDRTWRRVICINPDHELIQFNTNSIGNICCPVCGHLMIVEIKPLFTEE